MLDKVATTEAGRTPADAVRTATRDRIAHFLNSPGDVDVYGDLRGMCTTVSVAYRNRAVLELLQNAHDAHAPDDRRGRIRFIYDATEGDHGVLYAANDGRGFTEGDFKALCSPSKTTKTVNEAIGNKGVGFLSVFQICANPEVYSRHLPRVSADFDGFCFAFADEARLRDFLGPEGWSDQAGRIAATMPQLYLVTPAAIAPEPVKRLGEGGYVTVLRLPLKNWDARQAVEAQLTALATGEPEVQLFLERISELKIEFGGQTYTLNRTPQEVLARPDLLLQTVSCGDRRYVVARRTLTEAAVLEVIEADVAAEALPDRWRDWQGDAVISVAVAADGAPIKGRLYTFLPMGTDAGAPFAGHLDAPFFATIDRKDLEEGGTFNAFLLDQCRLLVLDAASVAKSTLADDVARHVLADLLFWTGDGKDKVRRALSESSEALIPAERIGCGLAWAKLSDIRLWTGGDFFSASRVARSAAFPLLDSGLGAARVANFNTLMFPGLDLTPSLDEKAEIAAAVALALHGAGAALSEWDRFYAALPTLLPNAGAKLQGRAILLTERHELALAEGPAGEVKRGRKRLSSVFMPPLRGLSGALTLPAAVQRRITYVNSKLACALDGSNPARRFLTGFALAREYDRREILRVMTGIIAEPGQAKDRDASRWETLNAILALCSGEGGFGDVAEIGLIVPTRDGWIRADEAFFGDWPGTKSEDLDLLLKKAGPVSPELQALSGKRLVPYKDWNVGSGERDAWVSLLRRAGVSDHLRPIPVLRRPPVRSNGNNLSWALSQRELRVSPEQKAAWGRQLRDQSQVANPQTLYTVRDAWRLPGQADYEAIAVVACAAYAVQVVRMLESYPALDRMGLFKPDHPNAPDRRFWPSPAGAFLTSEAWMPTQGEERVAAARAWLPTAQDTPPAQVPLVAHAVRAEIERSTLAREPLARLGVSVLGEAASAWRLLAQATGWLGRGRHPGDRLLSLTQDAWSKADLSLPLPPDLKLLARVDGQVIAFDPRSEERPIYIADAEDRAMAGALARVSKGIIVFEPPLAKAAKVAAYLCGQVPNRLQRMSTMEVVYQTPDGPFVPSTDDLILEDDLRIDLRSFVLLTVRYRCRFFTASPDTIVARLGALKVRWVEDLHLQVGAHRLPLNSFPHSAVLVRTKDTATVLAPRSAQEDGRALLVCAEAIGEAIGSRQMTSADLYTVAARLHQAGHGVTAEGLALALELAAEDVLSAMKDSRSVIAILLHVIRPFARLWGGEDVLDRLQQSEGAITENDLASALDRCGMQMSGSTLVEACRSGSVEAAALQLDVELGPLNEVLAGLGDPYRPIDRSAHHQEAFNGYFLRQEARVRESLRQAFGSGFAVGDLSSYLAARAAAAPSIPNGVGRDLLRSDASHWTAWLMDWLAGLGVSGLADPPEVRQGLEAVREANQRTLKALAQRARMLVLAKAGLESEASAAWLEADGLEGRLLSLAAAQGWMDFERLNEPAALGWLQRAGVWPKDWAASVEPEDHGMARGELAAAVEAERKARQARINPPRTMKFAGGEYVSGQTDLGSLADHIADLTKGNASLLASSSKPMKGKGVILPRRGPGGGGGGGDGSGADRMTDEEKAVVGFFGEAIAFEWLKEKFGRKRVVDHGCWKSRYRRHVCGEDGDDRLGYDFELASGKAIWFFEVKATSAPDPGERRMIELGSTEIAKAEACRAENRLHYRILHVVNALQPDKARLSVLPNPRTEEGKAFFTEQQSAGVRLYFPGGSRR